jgi:hypothetical protein
LELFQKEEELGMELVCEWVRIVLKFHVKKGMWELQKGNDQFGKEEKCEMERKWG